LIPVIHEEELASGRIRQLADCYARAIQSVAHYAIEMDPRSAADFRAHLEALEHAVRKSISWETLESTRSALRGELREYQRKIHAERDRLLEDLQDAHATLKELARAMALTNERHDTIELAGLHDEIRILHAQVDAIRKEAETDKTSGALSRSAVETVLNQQSCARLIVVNIANLRSLEARESIEHLHILLSAFYKRLMNELPGGTMVGRWRDDQFVAILPCDCNADTLPSRITRKLGHPYAIQNDGWSMQLMLEVTAAFVECHEGDSADIIVRRIAQAL
jgi:GGDEF domain-containing protein